MSNLVQIGIYGGYAAMGALIVYPVAREIVDQVKRGRHRARLDAGPSVAFSDVTTCVASGLARDFSLSAERAALEKHNRYPLSYEDRQECLDKHGTIAGTEDEKCPVIVPVMGGVVGTSHERRSYSPAIGGFQVLPDHPELAEPLYKTRDPKVLMRADGKMLAI